MNRYTVRFFARCPTNGLRIDYTLTIERSEEDDADGHLLVEELVDAVSLLDRGFHEELADQLHREFGGVQTLVADHHGVLIETRRGGQC